VERIRSRVSVSVLERPPRGAASPGNVAGARFAFIGNRASPAFDDEHAAVIDADRGEPRETAQVEPGLSAVCACRGAPFGAAIVLAPLRTLRLHPFA
jgi:hypothetical protein